MTTCQNKPIWSREIRDVSPSNLAQKFVALTVLALLLIIFNVASAQEQQMMVRISEIQVDANYLEQYKVILKEEAEASVRLEPGVIVRISAKMTGHFG